MFPSYVTYICLLYFFPLGFSQLQPPNPPLELTILLTVPILDFSFFRSVHKPKLAFIIVNFPPVSFSACRGLVLRKCSSLSPLLVTDHPFRSPLNPSFSSLSPFPKRFFQAPGPGPLPPTLSLGSFHPVSGKICPPFCLFRFFFHQPPPP